MAEDNEIRLEDLGHLLTSITSEMYGKILDKLGAKMTEKFLKDASQEEKESFINRMKEDQTTKLVDRMSLIMNRILADLQFIQGCNKLKSPYKSIDELRQDNEIANNHLQSVENERSIFQRDIDMTIDKLENLCELILGHKLVTLNNQT